MAEEFEQCPERRTGATGIEWECVLSPHDTDEVNVHGRTCERPIPKREQHYLLPKVA